MWKTNRLGGDGIQCNNLVDLKSCPDELLAKLGPSVKVDDDSGDPTVGHPAISGSPAEDAASHLTQQPATSLTISKIEPEVVSVQRQHPSRM